MKKDVFDRRTFLKGAVAGSAAAVIGALPQPVRGVGRGDSRVRGRLAEQSEKLSKRDLVSIESIDSRPGG